MSTATYQEEHCFLLMTSSPVIIRAEIYPGPTSVSQLLAGIYTTNDGMISAYHHTYTLFLTPTLPSTKLFVPHSFLSLSLPFLILYSYLSLSLFSHVEFSYDFMLPKHTQSQPPEGIACGACDYHGNTNCAQITPSKGGNSRKNGGKKQLLSKNMIIITNTKEMEREKIEA